MNVNGIPMSYSLIDSFRDAGAVCFNREIINQSRFDSCYSRHVLSWEKYEFLVKSVDENLVLYRAMLKFYVHKDTPSVHSPLINLLARFDPGDRITSYLLYYSELVLTYPCNIRGAALKGFIESDRDRYNIFFPHVSPLYMAQMLQEFETEE
jgi:hypothetical protein